MARTRRASANKTFTGFLRKSIKTYVEATRQPLYCLAFLLPFVAAYEFGALLLRPAAWPERTLIAQTVIRAVLAWLGATGFWLPGVVLLLTLLIWHVLSRKNWQLRGWVLPLMLVESVVLAAPLVAINQISLAAGVFERPTATGAFDRPTAAGVFDRPAAGPVPVRDDTAAGRRLGNTPTSAEWRLVLDTSQSSSAPAQGYSALTPLTAGVVEDSNLRIKIVLALGAALYEELVFRLALISLLSLLMIDLLRTPKGPAVPIIIVTAAVIFSLCHLQPIGAERFNWLSFLVRTAAGSYLALLFLWRGLGISAGCHAAYNLFVLLVWAGRA